MFISRKRYEEAIEKAKMEAARETEDKFHLWDRINRIEDQLYKRTNELEERLIKLQGTVEQPISINMENGFVGEATPKPSCL